MVDDVTWSCECGEVLKVPVGRAGKEYSCPKCHQRGWVPQPKVAPPRKSQLADALPPLPAAEPSMWTDAKVRRERLRIQCEWSYSIASVVRVFGAVASFAAACVGVFAWQSIGASAATVCVLWGGAGVISAFAIAAVIEGIAGILMVQLDTLAGLKLIRDELSGQAKPPDEGA